MPYENIPAIHAEWFGDWSKEPMSISGTLAYEQTVRTPYPVTQRRIQKPSWQQQPNYINPPAKLDFDPQLSEILKEPVMANMPTGMTTILLLDGQEQGHVTYFDYAIDDEGYAAGVFRYLIDGGEKRPKAGDLYRSLNLAWATGDNELVPLLAIPDVVIRAEIGKITPECAGFEVECRWHNGGPDA